MEEVRRLINCPRFWVRFSTPGLTECHLPNKLHVQVSKKAILEQFLVVFYKLSKCKIMLQLFLRKWQFLDSQGRIKKKQMSNHLKFS